MHTFPADFPDNCPTDAEEVHATIYHGCDHLDPQGDDFIPFASSSDPDRRERAVRAGCIAFGISCWKSEDAAKHAQEMFEYQAKRHIFKAAVTRSCGQLADTPSRKDSGHCTFWAYDGVSLKGRATLAWEAPGERAP